MSTSTNALARAEQGKRIALVIGVNEAPNSSLPPLKHSVTDAEAMAEVLQQCCQFELLEQPIVGKEATSDRVKKAVRKLARQRADEDFLLLYFSGHGQPMTVEADQPDVYLVTSDFDEVDVQEDEDAHFSMRWLSEKLFKATDAGTVLIILDCCYAGDIGRVGPDPYLEEIQARIKKYLGAPSVESGARSGGLRLALTATGHNETATERDGHGLMTGLLLPALRGEVDAVLEAEQQGQLSLQRLHRYLEITMPEQRPSMSGDFAGRACILASYPERAAQLLSRPSRVLQADRPNNYIPFPRNPLFQPRPGEFERLETLIFHSQTEKKPTRLGLVGVVGLGGVGKTQLAVELAYRCLDQQRFPAGTFWMPATGTSVLEWQHQFAELAFNTGYLPPDDDPSNPEKEARRARHFCRYLAARKDALLILDNVEDPHLVTYVLPILAGVQVDCPILYTSRSQFAPPGVSTYPVKELPEDAALRLLLEITRPTLLAEVLAGSMSAEAQAARTVCHDVGYLPLALIHLRGLLARDRQVTLVRLTEVLKQRGALEVAKTQQRDAAPLFATFRLSWEKIHDESAHCVFKLASYFPEAVPIPLWLLGLASGLGEQGDIFEPLGEACLHLQELSLLEDLSGDQVRLHPLVREFGRRLVAEENHKGKALLEAAAERLASEFEDLNRLEQRAQQKDYRGCLEQVRAAMDYVELLGTGHVKRLARIERWLDRESFLFGDEQWWPKKLPGLFYQQLYNRSVEEGHLFAVDESPAEWLRQMREVGAEDRSLLRIFAGHSDWVRSVAFSPDGRLVLTGSGDRTARLWELASGRQIGILAGHSDQVCSVAFSPDGRMVLTGSADGTARLWETASGKQMSILAGHSDQVRSVAFSPDGRMVLTGSNDATARLWEISSRKLLITFEGHSHWVNDAAFSPDGKLVLTGSADGTARLWETASGKHITTLEDYRGQVNSVAFSPDGRLVLTGSGGDQIARLWETTSGQSLARFEGHGDWVSSVAFSPDSRMVLTGSADGTARLWEIGSGKQVGTLEGHSDSINSVAFSPDGKLVLTGSWDKTARLWETGSGKQMSVLEGHSSLVRSVAFSPDGKLVLTGSKDKTARLWETASGKFLTGFEGHDDRVYDVVFSPDGKLVLTGSKDETACLWETSTGRQVRSLNGHSGTVNSVAFSPDGRLVLTGAWDRTARLWETGSGKQVCVLEGHNDWVSSVAFSPDGRMVLTGSADGTARLWKTSSGKQVRSLEGHSGPVYNVAFSPDGKLALTCDGNGRVFFWQVISPGEGRLLGLYVAAYEVGAIYWQDPTNVVLADLGGPHFLPHFYYLKLEGI